MESGASLDAFFALLETELRRHLRTFVPQVGLPPSNDVRKLLKILGQRWDDFQGAAGEKTHLNRNVRLAGSPVIASNFFTIRTALHCYHHKSPTHWGVIEQGLDSALRVLSALHDHAGINTADSVSQLTAKWQAVEKIGTSIYDYSLKIIVEDVGGDSGGSKLSSGSPYRLELKNLPAEVSVNSVMLALQAQDIDVTEAMVHLTNDDGSQSSEPYVELNSAEEQADLLQLGSIAIKRTPVQFVKPEELREVVLYLPKRLPPEAIAGAWENELGCAISEDRIVNLDEGGHVVIIRLTLHQCDELEGQEITLMRRKIKIRRWAPTQCLRLLLPSAEISSDNVGSVLQQHLGQDAHQIEEVVLLDHHKCAFVHLRSSAAKALLLQKKYFDLTTAATTTTTTTAAPAAAPISATAAPSRINDSDRSTSAASKTTDNTLSSSSTAKLPTDGHGVQEASVAASSSVAPVEGGGEDEEEERAGDLEQKVVLLSPLPQVAAITIKDLATLARRELKLEPKFIAVHTGQAFIRYLSSSTVICEQLKLGNFLVGVTPFVGEIPCWRVGLRSGDAETTNQLAHTIAPAIAGALRSIVNVEEQELGDTRITHDTVTIEVGSAACFHHLLRFKEISTMGRSLAVFDAQLDRTEQLEDMALVYYLKKTPTTVIIIEKQHSVKIIPIEYSTPTPTTEGSRGKAGYARIVGSSAEAVAAAWRDLRVLLGNTLVRKRAQFVFRRDEAPLRSCLRYKLKHLCRKNATSAVYVDEGEDETQPLVVHIMGTDAAEVRELAKEPNHIRTKLFMARSPRILRVPGMPRFDFTELQKTFNVTLAADFHMRQLQVVGFRDAVNACLDYINNVCAEALSRDGQTPHPPTAIGTTPQPQTASWGSYNQMAASPSSASSAPTPAWSAPAQPPTPTVDNRPYAAVARKGGKTLGSRHHQPSSTEHEKKIEYGLIETPAVLRLSFPSVETKYGVQLHHDNQQRSILVSGPYSAVTAAYGFIREFIMKGTRKTKMVYRPAQPIAINSTADQEQISHQQ